ncbi:C-X-C chemokine receptor type 3 [Salmo salar]|uniref:C-X-C chemokine receptor type 3 n=1 Tax=Salmo salar TaxID=8030 RepID=A0A1S3RX60_SALSA|nr:C-X-C chemokine receptor type 3-like [Salmo salar]|eukprot:XP_014056833.1 PREDICTED: C-X-C chemokine receptor type 3-like [Salmo salar]
MDSLTANGEKFTITISGGDLDNYYDEYNNYTDTSDTCCSTGEVCSLEEGMSFDAVFLPVFYSLTLVLGLLGNGLVLLVLVQRRRGWSVTDTFILHLCVADILLVLTLPFWAAQATGEWSFGTPLCKITGAIFTINFYCGIFLLACISLDRYLSVVHAVQMYSRRKPWMVQASCLSVWLLSILLSIPDWHFLESVRDTRRDKQECVHNYPSLSQSGFDWRLASRLLYHMVGFLLPSAVLLFCYSCILLRLQRGSQGLQKQRAVRVILALVLVFFLCWTPYNITLMVDTLYSNSTLVDTCESRKALDISLTATSSLGYLHCSLNPVLYAFVGVKFRHHLLDMLRSLGCKLKSGVRLQTASRRSSMWSESGDTSHTSAIY